MTSGNGFRALPILTARAPSPASVSGKVAQAPAIPRAPMAPKVSYLPATFPEGVGHLLLSPTTPAMCGFSADKASIQAGPSGYWPICGNTISPLSNGHGSPDRTWPALTAFTAPREPRPRPTCPADGKPAFSG